MKTADIRVRFSTDIEVRWTGEEPNRAGIAQAHFGYEDSDEDNHWIRLTDDGPDAAEPRVLRAVTRLRAELIRQGYKVRVVWTANLAAIESAARETIARCMAIRQPVTEQASTVRYRDDMAEGHELVLTKDEQGDMYVQVLPEGHRIGPSVRLCASGGAAELAPGLLSALRTAFVAIERGRAPLAAADADGETR